MPHSSLLTLTDGSPRPTPRAGFPRARVHPGIALSLLVLAGCGGADAAGDPAMPALSACTPDSMRIEDIVAEFQSRQQNVGLAVAMHAGNDVVFARGWGLADREDSRSVTPETRFGLASITKAFTGVALLTLVERGEVDLDATIQGLLPDFPEDPRGPVTLRRLAAHRAGIRHWGAERNDRIYARRFDDMEQIVDLVRDDAFAADRDQYSYSSYGYNILGAAIEAATGAPFPEFVQREVIQPLGLESVAFDRPGLGGDRRAARYSWYDLTDFEELAEPVRVPDWDYSHNMAGGNMIADVEDLVRFGAALREPGLLSDEAHTLLWTRPMIDGTASPMSFGWFVREDGNRIAISGSNPGLQGGLAVWRDSGLSVTVVANSWGIGSASGELVDDGPEGLIGRIAAACTFPEPGAGQ